jgi:sigma-B regulation protein RsbU (phosphoserine phosphatase)
MADVSLPTRYQALLLAARNLFYASDLDEVVDRILSHSRQMMQAEACSMYLPDRAAKELIIYSARGKEDRDFHTVRIPWDKGIAGIVFQTKKVIRIDDAQNDPRVFKPVASKSGFVTRAMITMPLVDRDECFGVLQAINPRFSPSFDDLDEEIFEGLASIVTSALLRLEREKRAVEEAKMAQEMQLAHEIQTAFLPPKELSFPFAEVHVKYQPARTIGGDFYTSISLPGDRVLVAAGDVSGKGIPAALTTAQVTGELSAVAGHDGDLAEIVGRINGNLCGKLAAGRFVATTFLLYDPHACTMEVICAGQFEPWRYSSDKWEVMEVPRSLPLGVFKLFKYEATVFSCSPGEKWLMFSDGITEGRNAHEEDYGFSRIEASLASSSPKRLLDHAWECWMNFVVPDALHDDACMVELATLPEPSLSCLSDPTHCKGARAFIETWANLAGYSDIERGQIVLAVDEAFTNIIRHAYAAEPVHRIDIRASIDEQEFHLRIRDYGAPVEKGRLQGRPLEDVKPGGLGLHLLSMVFPRIEYIPKEQGTELLLSKPLPCAEPESVAA